jgi:formate-dependent nitrite reductase membrane component NrfD
MQAQSVMITLLLGFLGMSITELLIPSKKEKSEKVGRKNIIIIACAYLLIGFANYKMEANFNFV